VLDGKRVLLIVGGGISAYKCLDLIRRLRERGGAVRCVVTRAGSEFVTPLSLAALSGDKVYQDLFSLTDESEMGHIRLSREADLVVVAPATADMIAKMAAGLAGDLATALLLATDKPILIAPAMNVRMWEHAATQANLARLAERGVRRVGPTEGAMACGEWGMGRMAEPEAILAAIADMLGPAPRLAGRRAVVTSGPTYEAMDPVRFIGNRSSGKQGHAIAAELARLGAKTVLVSGPTALPDPAGVEVVRVESARDMLRACENALPADIAICAAAVADWRVAEPSATKIKKATDGDEGGPPALRLVENPDILAALGRREGDRPALVVGFAAETESPVEAASAKRRRKGCDWMVANRVGAGTTTFGGDRNSVHLITEAGAETWPELSKSEVAARLVARIADAFEEREEAPA